MTPEEVTRDAEAFVSLLHAEPCEGEDCHIDVLAYGVAYRPTDGALLCVRCMAAWRASDEGQRWDHDSSLDAAVRRDAEGRR